jgi:arginase family enzyme
MYGRGGRHHYTYGLCTEVANRKSDRYAYFHFDAHPDWGDNDPLSCAGFVEAILNDSHAQALRYVGCGRGLEIEWSYKYASGNRIRSQGITKVIKWLLKGTPRDVYISLISMSFARMKCTPAIVLAFSA